MQQYAWARWGDLNAFFGLMLDNVAVMVILLTTIAAPPDSSRPDDFRFTPEFVLTRMIPGTAWVCSSAISSTPGWPSAWHGAPAGPT